MGKAESGGAVELQVARRGADWSINNGTMRCWRGLGVLHRGMDVVISHLPSGVCRDASSWGVRVQQAESSRRRAAAWGGWRRHTGWSCYLSGGHSAQPAVSVTQ